MGRGSRAGRKYNTIEELRGARGNASRKIIIFRIVSERGQVATHLGWWRFKSLASG